MLRKVLRPLPFYPLLRRSYSSFIKLGTTERHWARVVMNRETQKLVKSLQPNLLEVLEISGSQWSERASFKSYKQVSYPDFDICKSTIEDTFDLIIAEQVFEHLLWPYRAGQNVYKMMKSGGYFLITTPFLIRIHDNPTDCYRWTETGIKYLLAECGLSLENIRTWSWGNRACIRANFFTWVRYRPYFHSLRNEHSFPIVVWALAQK